MENPAKVWRVEKMLKTKVDNYMSLLSGRAENPLEITRMERMLHKKVDNKNVSVPKAGKKPCECETSGEVA